MNVWSNPIPIVMSPFMFIEFRACPLGNAKWNSHLELSTNHFKELLLRQTSPLGFPGCSSFKGFFMCIFTVWFFCFLYGLFNLQRKPAYFNDSYNSGCCRSSCRRAFHLRRGWRLLEADSWGWNLQNLLHFSDCWSINSDKVSIIFEYTDIRSQNNHYWTKTWCKGNCYFDIWNSWTNSCCAESSSSIRTEWNGCALNFSLLKVIFCLFDIIPDLFFTELTLPADDEMKLYGVKYTFHVVINIYFFTLLHVGILQLKMVITGWAYYFAD